MQAIKKAMLFFGMSLLLTLTAIFATVALAQGEKQVNVVPIKSIISKDGSYGIIIGINNYQQGITPLRYAAADAKSFFNVMTLPEYAGYNPNKFFLFSNDASKPELKPTRSNILQKLVTLQGLVTGGDTFYFYFSGHGIAAGGENYIILSDSILSLPQDSAISFSRLYELISGIDCKKKVIILDACRNQVEPGKGENDRVFVQAKYAYAEGTVTLYSTAPGERSYEDEQAGHGVFTNYIIAGLRGKGDLNGDKVISISELFDFVFSGTLDWATQNNRLQKPWKDDRSSGDIPISVVGGVGEVEYQSYTGGALLGASGASAGSIGAQSSDSAAFIDIGVIDGTLGTLCGFVTWKVNPPNAIVKVDSLMDIFSSYCSAALKSGAHRLTVSADGYDSQTVDFALLVGQRQTIEVKLKRNSGYLTVKVNPPDSKITLPNGTEVLGGFSDLLLENGDCAIEISHPDYWTEQVPVKIDAETPAVVEWDFADQCVPVKITVDPPDAIIQLTSNDSEDGAIVGFHVESVGFFEGKLPPGRYLIYIFGVGYLPYFKTIAFDESGLITEIKLELI